MTQQARAGAQERLILRAALGALTGVTDGIQPRLGTAGASPPSISLLALRTPPFEDRALDSVLTTQPPATGISPHGTGAGFLAGEVCWQDWEAHGCRLAPLGSAPDLPVHDGPLQVQGPPVVHCGRHHFPGFSFCHLDQHPAGRNKRGIRPRILQACCGFTAAQGCAQETSGSGSGCQTGSLVSHHRGCGLGSSFTCPESSAGLPQEAGCSAAGWLYSAQPPATYDFYSQEATTVGHTGLPMEEDYATRHIWHQPDVRHHFAPGFEGCPQDLPTHLSTTAQTHLMNAGSQTLEPSNTLLDLSLSSFGRQESIGGLERTGREVSDSGPGTTVVAGEGPLERLRRRLTAPRLPQVELSWERLPLHAFCADHVAGAL